MQRLKPEVRQKICAAALAEFKEYGYALASIRRIAERTDISLGNIYRYFFNKEALYLAVIEPFKTAVQDFVVARRGMEEQSCEEFARILTEFICKHGDELAILLKDGPCCKETVVDFLAETAALKIKDRALGKMMQFNLQPQSPEFYCLVAKGYVNAVLEIFRKNVTKKTRLACLTELTVFYFGCAEKDCRKEI